MLGWTVTKRLGSIRNFVRTREFYFISKNAISLLVYFRTLSNNNLTSLPRDLFGGLTRLRALRLSDNPFACDCHLSWLSRFLRSAPRLAPYTRCHSPSQLKSQNVADLHDQEFKCSGKQLLNKYNGFFFLLYFINNFWFLLFCFISN